MHPSQAAGIAATLQLEHAIPAPPARFHGHSMAPFLHDGDVLRIAPVAWDEIRPGDIVTLRLDDRFPTLRVVRRHGDRLTLIADNWPGRRFDAWREHVIGRVVERRRGGATLTVHDLAWRRAGRTTVLRYRAGVARSRLARRARRLAARVGERVGARFGAERPADEIYPVPANIQINVCADCNLRCRMCPYVPVHADARHQRRMGVETFRALLPAIRAAGAVHFSGAGEPLFHRQLFDFIALARGEVPGLRVDLTTNGTLLGEDKARQVIEAGVDKLHVSFDGLPGAVEAIRLGIHGSKVLANIARLAELRRAMGRERPVIQINYMLGYGTYRLLPDFIRLARGIGVAEIQLLEMQPATAEDAADNLLQGTRRDGGAALKEAVMLAQHAGIRLHLPLETPGGCRRPYNPHVAEDGTVYPCCYLDYDGRDLFHDGEVKRMPAMPLGNIADTSFEAIWSGAEYADFRIRTARGEFMPACQACDAVRQASSERVRDILGR